MDEPSSSRLKTHNELVAAFTAIDVDGDTWYLPAGGTPEMAFNKRGVNPELRALLSSAHILYKVAANTRDMFEALIAYMEAKGHDETVQPILAHQSALDTAMRCATEGVEKVLAKRK